MGNKDLEALEQQTFRSVTDDGLWDVLVASVFANLAIAPLLSDHLGDFWSSALLAPIWLLTYLAVWVVRRRVVNPRVGTVRFGAARQRRLLKLNIILLVVNVIAAGLGAVAAIGIQLDWLKLGEGSVSYPLVLGLTVLVGCTGVAHVAGMTRYYLYGLMLAIAPLIGEWLWRNELASHHGFPIVFGTAAAVILITGITRFLAVLRTHPLAPHQVTM
jgi:predicted small integral membrane protein